MIWCGRYILGLNAAFLFFILTSPVLAQGFSVSPAEVVIQDLPPGQETEFNLTIYNKCGMKQTFTLSTYNPQESQLRRGMAEFPDDSWITFPHRVEVETNSSIQVKTGVTVPSDSRWADKDWEIWLGVTPESGDILNVKLYVRMLVSTASGNSSSHRAGATSTFSSYQIGCAVCGVGIALVLAVLSVYCLRRRQKGK